ncbi:DUF859 family phage minor structural protein [Senegalia massiliensis]|uniref:Uncharacterized protein n=1 Tax=Senegalia massiliensis TaxID=1720316 RepID=A0A845R107_9CLOT|nr:DUF859 family phage minor structural protein [Senegalia massiliensis]NBI08251.1 hypothetical protein [Senegalia massiliensis]
MASLTWNPGINQYSPYVVLTVTEQSQSTSGNYSILAYSLKLYRPRQIYSSSSKSYNVKINGKTVKSGSTYIGGSGTKTIASGTTKVYHNSDGTKTGVAISFYQEISITWSGSSTGNASKSGSMNLTTIPRASIPTVNDSTVYLDDSVTIYTNRKSSAFTHTITYNFKGQTGTIGTGISTSKAWTIPKSLASKIPSDTSGTLTIYLKTYNGSTLIGTKSITIKIYVPNTSEFKPSIGTINISEAISGLDSKFGAYIKGKSKLEISYSSSGAYASSIKTKKISANGATYNSSSATTGYIKSSGTLTITATITDSRGRTVSKSTTVDVLDYTSPSISKLKAYRSNADGTENDEGEYAKVEVSGKVTPLNDKNTKSFKIKYKKSNESTYTVVDLDNSAYTLNTSIILPNIDGNFTYDIVFEVNDYFTSTPKLEPLPTAFTLVDYHANGRSMAIGKVSEGLYTLEIRGYTNLEGRLFLGDGSAGSLIHMKGSSIGRDNINYIAMYDSTGVTRQAYFGISSNHSDNFRIGMENGGKVEILEDLDVGGEFRNMSVPVNRGAVPEDWATINHAGVWSCSNGNYINYPAGASKYGVLVTFSRYFGISDYIIYLYIDSYGRTYSCMKWNGSMKGWKTLAT